MGSLSQKYESINGTFFAYFILTYLKLGIKREAHILVQDRDLSQNGKKAKEATKKFNASLLLFPPRSPDMNPI